MVRNTGDTSCHAAQSSYAAIQLSEPGGCRAPYRRLGRHRNHVPASFARQLGGYRINDGKPNVADGSSPHSIELSKALFEEMGVPDRQPSVENPGTALEIAVARDLQVQRPDLDTQRSRSVLEFAQYRHLSVFPRFRDAHVPASSHLEKIRSIVEQLPPSKLATRLIKQLDKSASAFAAQDSIVSDLIDNMPEEAFLNVDITVGSPPINGSSTMLLGLSSKWSLRTDRAQDCISQGAKLVAQRRGAMPHFAVVTMEPRPSMLKILADGSGSIDCVYHVDLPALDAAIARVRRRQNRGWSPGLEWDRLLRQGRIRDYDDLQRSITDMPRAEVPPPSLSLQTANDFRPSQRHLTPPA
jgi:hypothetical protein